MNTKNISFLPDHILRLMAPQDRKALGKAGATREEAIARAVTRRERELHDVFFAWLTLKRIPFVHSRMDQRSTIAKGWPDYTMLWKGRVYCVEFKAEGGRLSPEQMTTIEHLLDTGTPVLVTTSDAEAIDKTKQYFQL